MPTEGPRSPSGKDATERYQLLGEIGRGGMGRILKARDSEISREVAVKVMLVSTAQASEGQIRRFWTEVQALGQLEHPSIIPIHDVGRLPSGELFYVMKKLGGRTLADILSALNAGDATTNREFTRARLLTSLQQVAYAVAFAHAHGVIHRDIKPANIMVGQYGEAILIDWGLAKILDGQPTPITDEVWPLSASNTASGTITGTPQYMSPEATEGQPDLLTTRSDVYGLGAVLYEILVGEPAYPDLGFVPTVMRVRQGGLVPPRERAPDRNISFALEELCVNAMARDPAERPLAKELADELGRVLEGAKERERRSAEAKARVRAGRQAMDRWRTLKVELQSAETESRRLGKEVPPWAPVEDKAPVWTLEDRVSELKIEAVSAFEEAEADFLRALGEVPDDREARSALASLYFARFGEAERARDSEGQRYYRRLVTRYDDGVWQRVLEGHGTLEIAAASPAEVFLSAFKTQHRVMRALEPRSLGTTPVAPLRDPHRQLPADISSAGASRRAAAGAHRSHGSGARRGRTADRRTARRRLRTRAPRAHDPRRGPRGPRRVRTPDRRGGGLLHRALSRHLRRVPRVPERHRRRRPGARDAPRAPRTGSGGSLLDLRRSGGTVHVSGPDAGRPELDGKPAGQRRELRGRPGIYRMESNSHWGRGPLADRSRVGKGGPRGGWSVLSLGGPVRPHVLQDERVPSGLVPRTRAGRSVRGRLLAVRSARYGGRHAGAVRHRPGRRARGARRLLERHRALLQGGFPPLHPANVRQHRSGFSPGQGYRAAMKSIGLVLLSLAVGQAAPQDPAERRAARRTPAVIVAEKAGPSVVNISTRVGVRQNPFSRGRRFGDFFGRYFGQREQEESLGSGVIIHDAGLVLTNEHVVTQATDITVTLADRRSLAADVVGADPDFDIAVLKIRDAPTDLPVAKIGRSHDLMIGETVVAIGNPFGLTNTVTTGVVSALHRSIPAGDRSYEDFVQTDAAINPGNSGGALLNTFGELIGINTAIHAEGSGIGFAIPIDKAMAVVEEVLRYGEVRPAYVGLRVTEGPKGGALIRAVDDGGPAAQAGLRAGDLIVDVGGRQVVTGRDFIRQQRSLVPGQNIEITVVRDTKRQKIKVPVAQLDVAKAAALGRVRLGLEVVERRRRLVDQESRPPKRRASNGYSPRRPADRGGRPVHSYGCGLRCVLCSDP